MHKKIIVLFVLILNLLITSCSSSNLPVSTATPLATRVLTLTSTITPTITPTLTPTITFTPTPAPISIDNAKSLVSLQSFICSNLTFSPDLKKNTCGNVLSPDGKIFASIDSDGNIFLWNANSGEQIKEIVIHLNGEQDIAFTPDSRIIGVATNNNDNGNLTLVDAETGERLRRLACGGACRQITISPTGKIMASDLRALGNRISIVLWDMNTGKKIQSFPVPMNESITDIVFSPDGGTLASSGENGTIILWDVASGQPISTFDHISRKASIDFEQVGPLALAYSPDGRILASGYGGNAIILWDVITTAPIYVFRGNYARIDNNRIFWIAFSKDGTSLASTSEQGSGTIWGISNLPIPTSTPTNLPSAVSLDISGSFPETISPSEEDTFSLPLAVGTYTLLLNTDENTNQCWLAWGVRSSSANPNSIPLSYGDSNFLGSLNITQSGNYIISIERTYRSRGYKCQAFSYTLKVTQP